MLLIKFCIILQGIQLGIIIIPGAPFIKGAELCKCSRRRPITGKRVMFASTWLFSSVTIIFTSASVRWCINLYPFH